MPQAHRRSLNQPAEGTIQGIKPMIHHLPQRGARARRPRLFPIDGIHRLIEEEPDGAREVDEGGSGADEVRVEDGDGENVESDGAEADECNGIRG